MGIRKAQPHQATRWKTIMHSVSFSISAAANPSFLKLSHLERYIAGQDPKENGSPTHSPLFIQGLKPPTNHTQPKS